MNDDFPLVAGMIKDDEDRTQFTRFIKLYFETSGYYVETSFDEIGKITEFRFYEYFIKPNPDDAAVAAVAVDTNHVVQLVMTDEKMYQFYLAGELYHYAVKLPEKFKELKHVKE